MFCDKFMIDTGDLLKDMEKTEDIKSARTEGCKECQKLIKT